MINFALSLKERALYLMLEAANSFTPPIYFEKELFIPEFKLPSVALS